MALCDFCGSGPLKSSFNAVGTICQETPYLSLSHPHCWALGSPPRERFSQ